MDVDPVVNDVMSLEFVARTRFFVTGISGGKDDHHSRPRV